METTHIKHFLSGEECHCLHEWILGLWESNNLELWSMNNYIGGYRFHNPQNTTWHTDEYNRTLKPLKNIPELFLKIRDRISQRMGFEKELFRENATALAGVMFKDGYVEPHKDSSVEGHVHWRANVLLQCKDGGDPIIDGETYKLEAGDLIVFPADILEHSTTVQNSEQPRTLISYPFLLPHVSDII